MRQYQLDERDGLDRLKLVERPDPTPAMPGEKKSGWRLPFGAAVPMPTRLLAVS